MASQHSSIPTASEFTATGVSWPMPTFVPTASSFPTPAYKAYTSFSLPSSAELLYFLSRGNAHGTITFGVDSSLSANRGTDIVNVKVVASYFTNVALDRVSVCQLKRAGGEHGVGVYVSKRMQLHHRQHGFVCSPSLTGFSLQQRRLA